MPVSSCFSIVAALRIHPIGARDHRAARMARRQRYIEFRDAAAKVDPTFPHGNAIMSDLEKFRRETRAWLEANCPPEMRRPMTSDERHVLGRPQHQILVRAAARLVRADARQGLDRAGLAEGIWRRRARCRRAQGAARGDGGDRRALAAVELRHLDARAGAAEIRQRGAEEGASAEDRRAARSAGARAIPSRTPDRTSPRCRPAPRATATITSSTARRSGPPTPTTPTGSSAWCAPIPRPRSMTASASSCSTWPRRASRPSRSC